MWQNLALLFQTLQPLSEAPLNRLPSPNEIHSTRKLLHLGLLASRLILRQYQPDSEIHKIFATGLQFVWLTRGAFLLQRRQSSYLSACRFFLAVVRQR